MKRLILPLAAAILAGCNAGMEPAGPTPDQIRAKIDAMPPQKQIDLIEHSPMNKVDKENRIAQIRQKFNLPPSAGAEPVKSGPPTGAK